MGNLHFDATYNNADVMRKVRETQKAFAELGNTAEIQGRRIDAAFEKISLKSLERMIEIMKNFPKEIQGLSSFQKQIDGLEKHIERVNQRIASVGGGKLGSTFSDVSGNINIGDVLKEQVYVGSQAVNGLTEKIIQQRILIKDVEGDVRALGEAYKRAGEGTTKGNAIFADFKAAKAALQEEKNALFELQTQQAQARLSVRKLRDEQSLYQKEAQDVASANEKMSLSFQKTLAAIGGVAAIKQLGSEIIRVRGEFQSMQTAIETLVGKDMASNLIPQIKELAKTSPLTLTDMVGAEKMMLGFNINAEDTIRYLQALGDISMGNSQKFNSLTLAFSQMSATGKLMGHDLNQMINAGFNPLQQISDTTGKSMATLKDEMSKGVISTEMVQKAFIDATSAGGKFFGMSENASKTINGQLSMMQDVLDEVFNEIGTKGEGAIMSGIQATTSLIQNYETFGKILIGLIATFGIHKAALIANISLTHSWAVAARVDAVAKGMQTIATKAQTIAQIALNSAMKANPYVMVATLVAGTVAAMWAFQDSTTAAEKAQKKFNEEKEEAIKREAAHKSQIESLISTIQDETTAEMNRIGAMDKLKAVYPHIFAKYIDEKGHLRDIIGYKREIEEFDAKVSVGIAKRQADRAKQELTKVNAEIDYRQGSRTGASKFFRNKTTSELREMQAGLLKSYQLKQAEYDKLSALDKKASDNPITKTKNKEYWEGQKKEADKALSEIDSKQRALLNAGKFDKVDSKVVANYKEQKRLIAEAEKELKAYPSTSDTSKQDKSSDTLRKQQEKYNLLLNKQALDQSRSAEDLQTQVEQARINAMREGSVRTLAQMKLDHSKEMQQLERQQEDLLRKKIEEERAKFDAKEDEKAAKDPKHVKQTFDGSKVTLSQSEKAAFGNQKMYLSIQQAGETQALLDKERQSWNDYLSEYGTFQEKKEAITAEYNEKISNASTKGEKESLKKELENRIKEINLDELKASINFADIFGDLDAQSTEALTGMRDKLKEVIEKSAKDLKPTDLKALQDALQDMDLKISDRNPFEGLKNGIDQYKQSVKALEQAQKDLNTVQQGGEVIIGTYIDKTGKICTKLLTQEQAEKKLSDAQKKRKEAQVGLTQSVNSIGEKGQQLVNAGNDICDMLTSLGVEIPEAVSGTLEGLSQVMDSLANIDFTNPFSIVKGITGALAGIGKTIGSWLGINKKVISEETFAQYDRLINTIDELIDKQNELVKNSDSVSAEIAANEAKVLAERKKQAAQNLNLEYLNSYDGANHTVGYNLAKDLSGYRGAIEGAGIDWDALFGSGRMEGLADLDVDQIESLQKLPEVWAKLPEKVRDFLTDVVEAAKSANEATESMKENLTGISFDGFKSSFLDTLKDMDSSSKDFADNLEDYIKNAMLQSLLDEVYADDIKKLYEKFAAYRSDDSEGGNKITEAELEDLRRDQKELAERILTERNELADIYGWNDSAYSQTATSKGFQAMSQDTGDELNGRFTALQMAGEEIKNSMLSMLTSANRISSSVSDNGITLMEIRNIALMSNSHLEDIAGYQKKIINEFGRRLESIDDGVKKFNR